MCGHYTGVPVYSRLLLTLSFFDMKTAIKTEFLCVKPRSKLAQDRFDNCMDRLHSCRVIKRKHGRVFLESISNRYTFEMFEGNDDHWEVVT